MSQLETLEAKMASIEVSLSSTPRRKKNGSIAGISLTSAIRPVPKELDMKELESLRNALRDKENIIQSLKGQLTVPGLRHGAIRICNNNNNFRELTELEKKQAEDRLNRLKNDIDNKRLTIKNLKMVLERLDITDNIDTRIQQAELEYQLGREELNLLTLLEETRALQICIEESNKVSCELHTLYSWAEGEDYVLLQAIEIDYDPKCPKFGAGPKDSLSGLFVEWALEESQLRKGDRLIEINGKIVLNKTRDDLNRLLAAAPDPAQIVVSRKIPLNEASAIFNETSEDMNALLAKVKIIKERDEESQRVKEELRSDNIRLTHRISYLEEQVSELLNRKPMESDPRIHSPTPVILKSNQNVTNINIRTHSPSNSSSPISDVRACQKNNLAKAVNGLEPKELVAYPIRSRSSLSNVSNTHISSVKGEVICQKGHHDRYKHISSKSVVKLPLSNTQLNDKITYRTHNHHHHHHYREKDYNSESNSGVEQFKRLNKLNYDCHRNPADFTKPNSKKEYSNDIMDQSFKKATKIVHELTRSRDTTLYEKHRQKCITASEKYNADVLRHYNARKSTSVLDFRSEVHIGPKYESKSAEDLDTSEFVRDNVKLYKRIPDSRSVKSLDFDSDCNSTTTTNNHRTDYTSEPTSDSRILYHPSVHDMKPRPIPPKKPLRLSLHKTRSLHSVGNGDDISRRTERKRNYKGEKPAIVSKNYDQNVDNTGYREQQLKWNFRKSLENGSWC
nr:ERC protein 2 [Leptinotarsa decemlineata]